MGTSSRSTVLQTSSFDKKLIQTYIDEAELDALSTLKLITTAEKMEKFAATY
jgi:peptide methionine sulfoxide reductase MsrA